MPATRRLILIIIVLLLLLLFIVVPGVSWAQAPLNPWQDPARELAKKIAAFTGPRQTVALSVRNISSLSDSEAAAVRLALEVELRAAGIRLAAKPGSVPDLRITLSENFQGLLWVAEVPRGDSREVAMISLPRTAATPPTATTQMFVLQSKLIFEQNEPILHFALLASIGPTGTQRLLVFEPTKVELKLSDVGGWQPSQSAHLPTLRFNARDLRSTVEFGPDFFYMSLAGYVCRGDFRTILTLDCGKREDVFPRQFTPEFNWVWNDIIPNRNFRLASAALTSFPEEHDFPYYSGVFIQFEGKLDFLEANLDGLARIFRIPLEEKPIAVFSGWGSQLVGVKTGCGRGWQLMVTRPGDWTETDAIQALELEGTEWKTVSAAAPFFGPVIELWPSKEGNEVYAVVRNLKTGRYEAYTITLSCGR